MEFRRVMVDNGGHKFKCLIYVEDETRPVGCAKK
jgi:hypothetical protein